MGYLVKMKHEVLIFRSCLPDYSDVYNIRYTWERSVYDNVKESMTHKALNALGKHVILTQYIDTNM